MGESVEVRKLMKKRKMKVRMELSFRDQKSRNSWDFGLGRICELGFDLEKEKTKKT